LNDIESNAASITKSISRLAGILKIHLGNEDRYLCPAMKNSSDAVLQKQASKFQDEMGSLSEEFMKFKDNYNTQSKVINNKETAKK